jgi:ATP-dependent DNA helicase RecG
MKPESRRADPAATGHERGLGAAVTSLWGVGPERAASLARLDIRTIEDLLLHRPRRYEDRRDLRKIAELELHQSAIARGEIVAMGVKWYKAHTKSIFEFVLSDGTGRLHCRWWNAPYMEARFARGDHLLVFGKPVNLKPPTMDHPEIEVLKGAGAQEEGGLPADEEFIHVNRITPIYPLTEGISQRWLRGLIWRTLERFQASIPDPWGALGTAQRIQIPSSFPSRSRAIRMLHFPDTLEDAEQARRRLALDEFLALQCRIQTRRRNFEEKATALPCGGDNRLIRPFLARLGFKLTDAQTRVLRELRRDMSGAHPMRRLLQGDVGAGKTVVAACCALMTLESGYNVALMAPTEILAEQHFANFSAWLLSLGVSVELLTGSRKTPGEQPGDARGARPPTLYVGTHALITPGFSPENLGLVIIDEQHRFGVMQREQLLRKGRYPHLLVMTATPIPRTLGLTLYGDLDVSVIAQLPPGRGRIRTFVRAPADLPRVWEFIRAKLKAGRQAYIVYPRIEETGDGGIKAVLKEFQLVEQALAPWKTGLLHGRLSAREKAAILGAFRRQAVAVLLSTSMVEVGVDVPNATVMLIENAEQFGLAQLHQLRGRIGRGVHESYCILLSSGTREARRRLAVLEKTTDGFQIAEADLEMRGPGDMLGQDQSGLPRFRFGDLGRDLGLIHLARELIQREG